MGRRTSTLSTGRVLFTKTWNILHVEHVKCISPMQLRIFILFQEHDVHRLSVLALLFASSPPLFLLLSLPFRFLFVLSVAVVSIVVVVLLSLFCVFVSVATMMMG